MGSRRTATERDQFRQKSNEKEIVEKIVVNEALCILFAADEIVFTQPLKMESVRKAFREINVFNLAEQVRDDKIVDFAEENERN